MKNNIVDTITENVMRRITEARYSDIESGDGNLVKFKGRKPKTLRARMNQIYRLVHKYRIDSRKYHDENWKALRDYNEVIESLGGELSYWCEDGGYTDRDPQDGMPRSKVYNMTITYDDGMVIGGYIKMMAAGTVEDPFSSYDTCIVMWPKSNTSLE